MNYKIPFYIEERIRQIPPPDLHIVSGSTPVVAFGNPKKARVATLGLNPSKHEFLNKNGEELVENERRLETLNSLGLQDLNNISDQQVEQIWQSCNNYFSRNPYQWFDPLEKILKHFNVSYYSGTACHLDLVQWATNSAWSKLSKSIQKNLILQDKNFLNKQLIHENIEILLLNGRSVINNFQNIFECHLNEDTKLEENQLNSKIYQGRLLGIKVIGWSINLQSSHGVTNTFIEKIAETVVKPSLNKI